MVAYEILQELYQEVFKSRETMEAIAELALERQLKDQGITYELLGADSRVDLQKFPVGIQGSARSTGAQEAVWIDVGDITKVPVRMNSIHSQFSLIEPTTNLVDAIKFGVPCLVDGLAKALPVLWKSEIPEGASEDDVRFLRTCPRLIVHDPDTGGREGIKILFEVGFTTRLRILEEPTEFEKSAPLLFPESIQTEKEV